jgi:hypothetical protein
VYRRIGGRLTGLPARTPGLHRGAPITRLALIAFVVVAAFAVKADAAWWGSVRVERLMAGTPYETPLYVLDSGRPGPALFVLGGVHGNEPGAWRAADALRRRRPPTRGKMLVLPRADTQAVEAGQRSFPELGDLNRLYFGGPDGFPMSGMADEIVDVALRYRVDAILDLHESWSFHEVSAARNGGTVDLASLGQTISPHPTEPSRSLARSLVAGVNARLPEATWFLYHEFPPGHVDALIVPVPDGIDPETIPRKSALDLPSFYPGVASILVEVGQQQPMRDRVLQQIDVVVALLDVLARPRGETGPSAGTE